jgi:hypothetical protein
MATYVKYLRNAWSTITAYTTGKCLLTELLFIEYQLSNRDKWELTKLKLQEFDARFAEQQVASTKMYFCRDEKTGKVRPWSNGLSR